MLSVFRLFFGLLTGNYHFLQIRISSRIRTNVASLLSTRQRVAPDESWEPLEAQPEFARPRSSIPDDLLLAGLELLDVPGGKHELAVQEACFGGSEPDEEVGRERDYVVRKVTISVRGTGPRQSNFGDGLDVLTVIERIGKLDAL